jgi:hypothetical protein
VIPHQADGDHPHIFLTELRVAHEGHDLTIKFASPTSVADVRFPLGITVLVMIFAPL